MLSPAESIISAGERAARGIQQPPKINNPRLGGGTLRWAEERRRQREVIGVQSAQQQPSYALSVVAALMKEGGSSLDQGQGDKENENVTSILSKKQDAPNSRMETHVDVDVLVGSENTTEAGMREFETKMGLYVASDNDTDDSSKEGELEILKQNHSPQNLALNFDSDDMSSDGSSEGNGWNCSFDKSVTKKGMATADDPIMKALQKAKSQEELPQFRSSLIDRGDTLVSVDLLGEVESPSEQEQPKVIRNPNRFFHDLDRRLATKVLPPLDDNIVGCSDFTTASSSLMGVSNIDKEVGPVCSKTGESRPPSPPNFRSFAAAGDKLAWFRSVAAPHIQHVTRNVVAKIKERTAEEAPAKSPKSGRDGPFSKIHRTSLLGHGEDTAKDEYRTAESSSFLKDEEQAELDRLHASASVDLVTMFSTALQRKSKFIFIGFTLILAFFVYFYSMHLTEDLT